MLDTRELVQLGSLTPLQQRLIPEKDFKENLQVPRAKASRPCNRLCGTATTEATLTVKYIIVLRTQMHRPLMKQYGRLYRLSHAHSPHASCIIHDVFSCLGWNEKQWRRQSAVTHLWEVNLHLQRSTPRMTGRLSVSHCHRRPGYRDTDVLLLLNAEKQFELRTAREERGRQNLKGRWATSGLLVTYHNQRCCDSISPLSKVVWLYPLSGCTALTNVSLADIGSLCLSW